MMTSQDGSEETLFPRLFIRFNLNSRGHKKVIKCNLSLIFFFLDILKTFWPVFIWVSPRIRKKRLLQNVLSLTNSYAEHGPLHSQQMLGLVSLHTTPGGSISKLVISFFSIISLVKKKGPCHWKSHSQIT